MAVLKRGDKAEIPSLDSPRRFAQSFALAWGMLCGKIGKLITIHLCPAVVVGILGCVWLNLHCNELFWYKDRLMFFPDFVFGALILYVCSFMRQIQAQVIVKSKGSEMVVNSFRFYASSMRAAFFTWLPLLCAFITVYASQCLLNFLGLATHIVLACFGVVAILSFSFFGMVQSYLETFSWPFWRMFRNGLVLNGRYFGSFCFLFLLSMTMLSVVAALLYFGDYILFFLDENISNAQVMGDDFVCPWYVEVLKYLLFFVATVLMALAQSVWSLPQQVHIRSVIYKYINRHKAE